MFRLRYSMPSAWIFVDSLSARAVRKAFRRPSMIARYGVSRGPAVPHSWKNVLMILEITTSPRETLVWAPTLQDADELRRSLSDSGNLVLEADPWELDFFGRIPDDGRHEFDPARILNVEIGITAHESLAALLRAGHELRWHRWQRDETRDDVWGVPVASPEA